MPAELLILRLVHILGGVFWVGTALFSVFFLGPSLAKMGPAAGQVMAGMQQRKFFVWMPVIALLTILSGLRLMMIVSGGDPHWFQHRVGHAYAVSGASAILAFLIGMLVGRPAMVKAAKLGQSAASDPTSKELIAAEVAKLQKRSGISSMVVTVLLLVAAAGMAIARYL